MPAPTNTNTTANIAAGGIKAREIDFVTRFNKHWEDLVTILGIMRPIRKAPGTKLVAKKATVSLVESVGEGELINNSAVTYEAAACADLTIKKYKTSTTIEAVDQYGAEIAVQMTDEAFLDELQTVTMAEFYEFVQTGTLTAVEETFQMAVSMAIGRVKDKFKRMHRSTTDVIVFVNTLDLYRYLGSAPISVQSQYGLDYLENFLGARVMVVTSDIPAGKVVAVPQDNVVLYYADPRDSDFMRLGLEYTVQGVTNLIGFHVEGDYDRAVGNTYAIMGLKLWAEYLDGIAVVTIGEKGTTPDATLSSLTIGSLTLTPEFDRATTTYTAATENATNTITATATDANATIAITVGETAVTNGTAATWAEGANTVTITVTNGGETETYTVTVTKSEAATS